jgi:chromosome segregation ATPase
MIDPRFKEVLEFIEERDEDGAPTVRAKIAIKIQAYAQDVDDLRKDLATIEEEAGVLQATVDSLTVALDEQANRKTDLVTEAQDAAVRAAMSGSGAGSARLRKQAQNTRDRIAEFGKDYEAEANRLAQAQISLTAKKQAVKDQRGMIVRRLNTMSSLADRAGVEFGTELLEKEAQSRRPQQPQAAPRMMRRRPRRVRVRRRRAS